MAPAPTFTFESINENLEIARTHARQGKLAEAEHAYQLVVSAQADQVEALRFLANAALARNDAGEAVSLLNRAAQADRTNIGVLMELGVAYRYAQRMDESRSVLELALESSQGRNTTARLLLANVLEQDARPDLALLHYFRAILDAQANGQWRNDATTDPSLRQLVHHAMQYVDAGRHARFQAVVEPFRRGTNAARLGRIDAALATYLHERDEPPADSRQKPTFLHVPDSEATCFPDPTAFDKLADLGARIACLDDELRACIDEQAGGRNDLSPFSLESMTTAHDSAVGSGVQQIPLYQRGIPDETIRKSTPGLFGLLESEPLVHIPNYAPNATILMLQPGATTPLVYGRTNAFCTIATVLSGSALLQITVGGEARQVQPGTSLVFDPSFGFEYRATSGAQACVLVFETWNPGISPLERDTLSALIASVVAFDASLQELA